MTLLRIDDLTLTHAPTGQKLIDSLSFEILQGEVLGVIGESGSGKSLLCKSILGLNPPSLCPTGRIDFQGIDLLSLPKERLRPWRGQKIALILQEAMSAFDPLSKIGSQMVETLRLKFPKERALEIAHQNLHQAGLQESERILKSYPHELSGGELQRVMIALAITQGVELIIADEPTSALDLLWQKRILEQFQAIQESRSLSLLFVSHDLAAIAHLADRILVMHQGREVECAPTQEIFSRPTHPQTQKLIQDRQLLLQGLHP